jgi:capsule polysaccharide export protein KpsE/RkpR
MHVSLRLCITYVYMHVFIIYVLFTLCMHSYAYVPQGELVVRSRNSSGSCSVTGFHVQDAERLGFATKKFVSTYLQKSDVTTKPHLGTQCTRSPDVV